MKFKIINIKNSKFDDEVLWLVAQDLEHLTTLHNKTNSKVIFNYLLPHDQDKFLYKEVSYTTFRKIFNIFKIKLTTVRRIDDGKIIYIENHNYIKTKVTTTHTIKKCKNYVELKDEIIFDVPFYIYLFKYLISFMAKKHLNSQYNEDEFFRERLQKLKDRGILKKHTFLEDIPISNIT